MRPREELPHWLWTLLPDFPFSFLLPRPRTYGIMASVTCPPGEVMQVVHDYTAKIPIYDHRHQSGRAGKLQSLPRKSMFDDAGGNDWDVGKTSAMRGWSSEPMIHLNLIFSLKPEIIIAKSVSLRKDQGRITCLEEARAYMTFWIIQSFSSLSALTPYLLYSINW